MSNVTFMHFEHGSRWVWDSTLGYWIAPPRPRSRANPKLVRPKKKVRK